MSLAQHILVVGVRVYRLAISPAKTFLVGPLGHCRFTPSCSAYALEAITRHGALGGTRLALARVCRCHPWGGCGDDPVPPLPRPDHATIPAEEGNLDALAQALPPAETATADPSQRALVTRQAG